MTPGRNISPARVLGIDIGGSNIKTAIVSFPEGQPVETVQSITTPTPSSPGSIRDIVADIVRSRSWSGPVGIGYPGVIKNGVACSAANISVEFMGQNLEEVFRISDDIAVRVINDADAAALTEMAYGAGKPFDRADGGLVLIATLGTGIGTALVYNGRLLPNTEFGHMYLSNGQEAEAFAAASIRRRQELDWKEFGQRVDLFLQEMETLLSYDVAILGGGIVENFRQFESYLTVRARVLPAETGNDAGLIGAAMTALD
jgi:polyphosphate glucokinase